MMQYLYDLLYPFILYIGQNMQLYSHWWWFNEVETRLDSKENIWPTIVAEVVILSNFYATLLYKKVGW
jgi:hypothetical protein